ncbi:protein trichome birefringence-like 24 [Phragmites australis]|uniref:protein trichome birefringence-like 24 n=1 Tax=Phragmites australis TaxID=29695 RepID=UPI002D764A0B|nr:protein trichome birefringence-like 24 [Phragmites australis]
MGTEWPAAPQRKVVGGGVALKLLLFVLLACLALRLLVGPAAYLLPLTAAPEGAALVVAGPGRERTGGGGTPPTDDIIVAVTSSGPLTAPDKKQDAQEETDDAVITVTSSIPCTTPSPKEDSPKERCDLFHGEWVPHTSGPAYTNATCRFIESPQNCMTNGRPDTGYLYWRWKPYGCDIPPFEGKKFLDGMRGKHWALIGDSILRNHVQSLLCLLSKVEDPTEVYHDKAFRSRRWHFPSHNFTVSLIWAPFLIKAEIFEDENGVSTSELQLHLDILDTNWTRQWESFDYVVISTGQWFFKTAVYWENETVIGCHSCQNKNLTEITYEYSFRKSLREAFQFIASTAHKPVVFYRTWAPSHFENGEWFSGGTCNRKVPFKPGEAGDRELDSKMWRIEKEEFDKVVENEGPNNPGRLKLLDTFELSLLRPDGHSGPYRTYHPYEKGRTAKVQNDCLHWCLPGPIDAWNDMIMQMLAKV